MRGPGITQISVIHNREIMDNRPDSRYEPITVIFNRIPWGVRGAGGTVVVHVSLTTVTRVRFRLRAVTLVTCEKSVVPFDATKHRRFSPGPPVSSCSNTGPMGSGFYWTFRERS